MEVRDEMVPFWKGDTMIHESILMVSQGEGQRPEAQLLFKPDRILSVYHANLLTEYSEGKDWTLREGKLELLPHSTAPSMRVDELYVQEAIEKGTYPMADGRFSLWASGKERLLIQKQLVVTYTHSSDAWRGPIPQYAGDALPLTISKLKNKAPLKVVLYGDSISTGAESSGKVGIEPFLPSWGELVILTLTDSYKGPIQFINPSVGGKTSLWGRENVNELVTREQPDLVMIAFGMNDGSGKVAPENFRAHIEAIMNDVKQANAQTEFILVSPMLPNPELAIAVHGTHRLLASELRLMTGEGVALADLTAISEELLRHKRFRDMTGNHVNHPNDFLARWYAQSVAALLLPNE